MRTFAATLSLILLLFFSLAITPAEAGHKVVVHFIVVPALALPRAMTDFKAWLAKKADGYTYLGRTERGFMPSIGKLWTKGNHSFIVSWQSDLSYEIEAFAAEIFGGERPYILTWSGESNW